jgi:hypothetical protein
LFSDDIKLRTYFVAKIFPFSLKDAAKTWFNNLSPGSIHSPIALVNAFFQKYFPTSAQHAAVQKIFDFEQGKGEILPESWTRFCSLIRSLPKEPLPKNKLLDIFYNGLTDESKSYLDSCANFLRDAEILDDFSLLINRVGLTTYMMDESNQYAILTKIFVESFKFANSHFNPSIAFKIYDKSITMSLERFCNILGIPMFGTAKKMLHQPTDLLELY